MTATRSRQDNGSRTNPVPDPAPQLGAIVNTADIPALMGPDAYDGPHLFLDATQVNEPGPEGSHCIRIIGPRLLSARAAIRLGEELIQLGTYVGERRSLVGGQK